MMDETKPPKDTKDSEPRPPLSFRELVVIVLSGHLGVRNREHRVADFERANGLHVFLAASFYFALVITGLILLVTYITG